jgi:hypothetical protein
MSNLDSLWARRVVIPTLLAAIFTAVATLQLAPVVLASVPAAASVVAAVVAAVAASRTKSRENEAARIRDLESRISEKKYAVYKPMIDALGDVFDLERAQKADGKDERDRDLRQRISDFWIWITIYGSDDAVRAFHRFMQSTYVQAPAPIMMRLYADFVLAARRDIGYPKSDLNAIDFLGIRISDIYSSADMMAIAGQSFDSLCKKHDWQPPWQQRIGRR